MSEPNRCKDWAPQSLQVPWMAGERGPANFASAVCGSFDEGSEAVYRGLCLRYPYGPFTREACKAVGARVFPAANDDARLAAIGSTFQLPRVATETGARYEERLGLAWSFHAEGGTSIAIRKALEAYGFPESVIAEECYYQLLAPSASYHWAFVVVLGPNYGDVDIASMVLGAWELGDPSSSYLGTGNFSSAQADDVIRLILFGRQVFDSPLRLVFRFGDAPLLGLITLGAFNLGGSPGSGVAYRNIQARHTLGAWLLGSTTFAGFGV